MIHYIHKRMQITHINRYQHDQWGWNKKEMKFDDQSAKNKNFRNVKRKNCWWAMIWTVEFESEQFNTGKNSKLL
jgi:hypothetical protein